MGPLLTQRTELGKLRKLEPSQRRSLWQALTNAVSLIRDGKWCRNEIELNGQYCALGLVGTTTGGGAFRYCNPVGEAMIELLDASIPEREFEALRGRSRGQSHQYREHDGYWRGSGHITSRIASWSNTRPTEREVVAWFESARELLETTNEQRN